MEPQKQKPSLQIRLTCYIGGILFVSNTLLVLLLLYNFGTALAGFEIPINGEQVLYHFDDHLEERLLLLGVLIAVFTTVAGTGATYVILGRVLEPLKALSLHMQKADQENIQLETNLSSKNREVDSLITSYDSMSRKLHQDFLSQKNFSSYVAHELRTPLAVMQARMDLYRKKPEKADELIDMLSGETAKLSTLVTEILDLSGIRRAELTELVPCALLAEEVTEDLEEAAEEAGITLSGNLDSLTDPADPRYEVLGNHNLLYRALFNLVQNAIKYNRPGGTVTLTLTEADDIIQLEVRDDGFGIPQEYREHIFDPFYRAKTEEATEKQGHGLGLSLAKEIITHHKGRIQLLDTEEGTAFLIKLHRHINTGG